MEKQTAGKKEPWIRIAKRGEMKPWRRWLVRVVSIALALVFTAVIIVLLTKGKVNPLSAYSQLFEGAFGTSGLMWNTLRDAMVLLLVALALAPAFRMKFWNVGGEGQILIGGLATATVMMFGTGHMPTWLLFVTMIAVSLAAGLIWGLVPAYFKARWNTNETLFTLMMNYIAIQLVNYCNIIWEAKEGTARIDIINASGKYEHVGWLPTNLLPDVLGNRNYIINLLLVLGITVFMYVYMKYTKHGYEIAVVGESVNTARYSGITIRKVILRTMALSGAICGLAGFLLVSGSSHTITSASADGRGFTAIIVAWLSKFNPLLMLIVSVLLVALDKGFGSVGTSYFQYGLNANFADVATGIILFFVIGSEFFIEYRVIFRGRKGARA